MTDRSQNQPAETADEIDPRYQKIWNTVRAIPKGRVMSYGQVAAAAGMPRRARFVSRALRAAPESLALPWHRVIRSDGSIAFAAGSSGYKRQARLLRAEGVSVTGGKVQAASRSDADDLDYALWAID